MDSSLQQADLDKLNDKDKTELRQFLTNNEQRARIQQRLFSLFFFSSPSLSPLSLSPSVSVAVARLEHCCVECPRSV